MFVDVEGENLNQQKVTDSNLFRLEKEEARIK